MSDRLCCGTIHRWVELMSCAIEGFDSSVPRERTESISQWEFHLFWAKSAFKNSLGWLSKAGYFVKKTKHKKGDVIQRHERRIFVTSLPFKVVSSLLLDSVWDEQRQIKKKMQKKNKGKAFCFLFSAVMKWWPSAGKNLLKVARALLNYETV